LAPTAFSHMCGHLEGGELEQFTIQTTGMRHITTFQSMTDRIYDGDPIRL